MYMFGCVAAQLHSVPHIVYNAYTLGRVYACALNILCVLLLPEFITRPIILPVGKLNQ